MHIPKPYKKRLQLLRKRKRDADSVSDDNLLNDDQSTEEIHTPVKCIKKQVEILTQDNIKKDILDTINNDNEGPQNSNNDIELNHVKNEGDTDMINHDNKDTDLISDSQNSIISVRKIEDLCKTPQKNIIPDDSTDTNCIKIENTDSPNNFSPLISDLNFTEWSAHSIKSLIETPVSCKKQKPNSDITTPNTRKKRKFCLDINDYDQLSDVVKSELCNNVLPDMEAIDMLHDLNNIMDFEDVKISDDIFTSTANNTVHNEYDLNECKDPLIDPLFIESNDECNTITENIDHRTERRQTRSTLNKIEQTNRQSVTKNNAVITQNSKLNKKKTFTILSDILGELDIDSEIANKKVSEEDLEELYNINIKLLHDVPPQHTIEQTSGVKGITKEERQLFLKYGPIKRGPFSPNEDRIVLNNWRTFCEVHNWNPKHLQPLLHMKHGTKFYIKSKQERQKFIQFLANGLPWRTLYSVYNRFKYLHGNHEKSFKRYTLFEDKKILSYIKERKNQNKQPKIFHELSKVLGRTTHSIWLRYQLLKKMQEHTPKKSLSEVEWTLPLIAKFVNTFMDITLCENVRELKDATIPKQVWLKLEEKLKIDHNVLKHFWIHQLHMQLFCPEPIYLNDIKIKLIEYFYGKGIAHIREIIWPNVAKYFDGITTIFLCRTFYYLVAEAAMKIGSSNFCNIVEYLYNEKIADIKNELTDKFLPRLSYKNKKVKIVDENLIKSV